MTILTAVPVKSLHLPRLRLPGWPQFKLGRRLSEVTQAYASAISIPYTVALRMGTDEMSARERLRRKLDY